MFEQKFTTTNHAFCRRLVSNGNINVLARFKVLREEIMKNGGSEEEKQKQIIEGWKSLMKEMSGSRCNGCRSCLD